MKRILSIVILAAAVSNIATAQIITSKSITRSEIARQKIELKRGYRGFAEVGGHFDLGQPSVHLYGFDLTTTHGYQINRWLFLGAGIGLQSYKLRQHYASGDTKTQLTLPLYADIRTYFTRTAVKPFAEMQIGYRIRCNKPLETVENGEYEDYHESLIVWQDLDKTEIASGLHFGIGVGAEYKRFSLKVMWSIVKRPDRNQYYRNNILTYDNTYKNRPSVLSFTLGVNF